MVMKWTDDQIKARILNSAIGKLDYLGHLDIVVDSVAEALDVAPAKVKELYQQAEQVCVMMAGQAACEAVLHRVSTPEDSKQPTPAEMCRMKGWVVGDILVNEKNYTDPCRIQITAIGERVVLAKRLRKDDALSEFEEVPWDVTVDGWGKGHPVFTREGKGLYTFWDSAGQNCEMFVNVVGQLRIRGPYGHGVAVDRELLKHLNPVLQRFEASGRLSLEPLCMVASSGQED
jgi:hypothetical protein